MAIRPLTSTAGRFSSARKSLRESLEPSQSWRRVLATDDADAIWTQILSEIRSYHFADDEAHLAAQNAFLYLLASNRLEMYVRENWPDDDIARDIRTIALDSMKK